MPVGGVLIGFAIGAITESSWSKAAKHSESLGGKRLRVTERSPETIADLDTYAATDVNGNIIMDPVTQLPKTLGTYGCFHHSWVFGNDILNHPQYTLALMDNDNSNAGAGGLMTYTWTFTAPSPQVTTTYDMYLTPIDNGAAAQSTNIVDDGKGNTEHVTMTVTVTPPGPGGGGGG